MFFLTAFSFRSPVTLATKAPPPLPEDLLAWEIKRDLDNAREDLRKQLKEQEYANGWVKMLRERVARLEEAKASGHL